jgi:hypothetical protein
MIREREKIGALVSNNPVTSEEWGSSVGFVPKNWMEQL